MNDFPDLHRYPIFAMDTETTGIEWWENEVFGVSISTPDGKDFYWDLRDNPNAIKFLQGEIPKCSEIIFHNAKFDCHHLRQTLGLDFNKMDVKVHDTMIRAAICNEHEHSYSLDNLSRKYLKAKKVDVVLYLASIFGGPKTKNVQMPRLQFLGRTWPNKPHFDVTRDFEAEKKMADHYASIDTRLTMDLFENQINRIESQNQGKIIEMEMELFFALLDMEHKGVNVDTDQAEQKKAELKIEMGLMEKSFLDTEGFIPNVNCREDIWRLFGAKKDVKEVWRTDKGEILASTPGGDPSFSKAVLQGLIDPRAAILMELRNYDKLIGTFFDGHILGKSHNGIVHTSFNQTRTDGDLGTRSGRLSSSNPNLQQIHKRNKKLANIIRPMFLPDKGQWWSCRDWSQMDFRVFAHYVQSEVINKVYMDNPDADFHQLVADLANIPRNASEKGGANAKQMNLAQIFGMGEGKLAKEMGLPYIEERWEEKNMTILKPGPEAIELSARYHNAIPGIKNLKYKCTSVAKSRGYVNNILGGRIRFPSKNEAYKAAGLLFQGSAAMALKVKIIEVWKYLDGTEGRMFLNVHDEFNTSVPPKDTKLREGVREIVEAFGPEDRINFKVPIRSDEGFGKNWAEASL